MLSTKSYSMDIEVMEHTDHTEAKVTMGIDHDQFSAWGRARRNPSDPDRPVIGDELAVARALNDLAHQLLHTCSDRIEEFEHRPAELKL
ncbi:MAG TPA: DUF1876 domain-containing protein [Acidimicrobiales bacterium]|jgi:hypothetical protein